MRQASQESQSNCDQCEDEASFTEIDKLQAQNINMGIINKLKSAGFQTVLSIIMATKKELLQVKGISDAVIEKLQQAARVLESRTSWTTAAVQLQRRQNILRITTGSNKLDELLQGGIESQALTEVFGEFRTGKTQLCHTLCVTAQMSKQQHGGAGKVAYIDTEGTFRPERVAKIAERYGLDPEQVLENILYARAFTSEHQSELITLVAAKMFEENFALMIVDSIMALFRVDFTGRGELSERQQQLGKLLSKLMKLAEQFNIAVFMTNQVQSDPGGGMTFVPDPKKPIGGNIIAHASTTRLYLRKGKGENRVCKIFDSPCLAESEATDDGISDATE